MNDLAKILDRMLREAGVPGYYSANISVAEKLANTEAAQRLAVIPPDYSHETKQQRAVRQYNERNVKWHRYGDIDPYEPDHHNFKIGDTIRALCNLEFSWGFKMKEGDIVLLRDNISLWQIDYPAVNIWFEKV